MLKPLAIDLFCGLGGWAEGFLAEGYDMIGFDIERHIYRKMAPRQSGSIKQAGMSWSGSSEPGYKAKAFNDTSDIEYLDGYDCYPGQLVLQDALTLHGSQFRNAAVIVASPPCQAYSYRAMPWKRAKALPPPSNELFDTCFRIQREASESAGHYIPMVVENVKGAQRWVGGAKWHYGSFYLWGDVPALMPFAKAQKVPVYSDPRRNGGKSVDLTSPQENTEGIKGFTKRFEDMPMAWLSSKSNARKAASAQIAKIPFPLAQYIAQHFKPEAANRRAS